MTTLPEDMVLPLRTISGTGSIDRLLPECMAVGARGILVHGHSLVKNGRLRRLTGAIDTGDKVVTWCHPGGEPTLGQLEGLLEICRARRVEWVAAIGGGSVLDVAKAAAGLMEAPLSPKEYHAGAPIEPSRIPFIAAPATAGTGSEATTVSVLTDADKVVKKSIRHPSFMARLVILDPDLTAGCPPEIVANSGADALTQAIEAYASRKACVFTDAIAAAAIPMIHGSLPAVYRGKGGDAAARLLQGSYLAGIALSGARLGAVHGLAHPLGARYHLPHGLVCAVCLLPVLRFNREAMGRKYAELARLLGGDPVEAVSSLLDLLAISSPFKGEPIIDEPGIIRETLASGSTAANPRTVAAEDVSRLLQELFAQ